MQAISSNISLSIELVNKNLNQLLDELNLYLYEKNQIKMLLELVDEIEDLIQHFFKAIFMQYYQYAMVILEKFYFLWIDTQTLKYAFSQVETYVVMLLVSLAIHSLSTQLAWMAQYSYETAYGLTLLTICVGIKVMMPFLLINNGLFKIDEKKRAYYQLKGRFFKR